jgi:Flp pilus assembly protein TadG
MFNRLRKLLRGGRGEEGVAAVELAIILSILLILVVGGMDIAHMYYMNYIITNASREGARYAAKYTVNPDGTPCPTPTSDQVSNYVTNTLDYSRFNFPDFKVSSAVGTSVSPNGATVSVVTVTVRADKYWWFLGSWLGFQNPKILIAQTAMAIESP